MRKDFEMIRIALEEHLSSINENTSEIQALFDYLHELEVKVNKLSERLEVVQLDADQGVVAEETKVDSLNQIEKNAFLVLYTEDNPLTYIEIAMKARIPFSAINDCISSLIGKGIPLLRSLANNQMFFKLSPSFKERQAKENLINLSLQSFIE